MAFTHKQIWRGLDRLAEKHGLSASGLARRAGLDATAFNVSKRVTREGGVISYRVPRTVGAMAYMACQVRRGGKPWTSMYA